MTVTKNKVKKIYILILNIVICFLININPLFAFYQEGPDELPSVEYAKEQEIGIKESFSDKKAESDPERSSSFEIKALGGFDPNEGEGEGTIGGAGRPLPVGDGLIPLLLLGAVYFILRNKKLKRYCMIDSDKRKQ